MLLFETDTNSMAYNKYKNKPTVIDGIRFDSQKEGLRYNHLKLLVRAGEITNLELQPKYKLTVNGKNCGFYKGDFRYTENGLTILEDVKSPATKTAVYNLKKKLVKAIYDVDIQEV